MTGHFQLGTFRKTHGYAGGLVLPINFKPPTQFHALDVLFLEVAGQALPYFIEQIKTLNDTDLLVQIEGIIDSHAAQAFVGQMVYLPVAMLPNDESLAMQDHDLIGFQVQDPSLEDSLVVIDVLERRMQPLLCLGHTDKEPHIFIPYVDAFIDRVELVTKTIHLKAPSELYQLD